MYYTKFKILLASSRETLFVRISSDLKAIECSVMAIERYRISTVHYTNKVHFLLHIGVNFSIAFTIFNLIF